MSSDGSDPLPLRVLIEEIHRTTAALQGGDSVNAIDGNEDAAREKELLELSDASMKLVSAIEGPMSTSWKLVQAVGQLYLSFVT